MNKIDWSRIRAVAFDIDDTFSTQGHITPEAFAALWKLHQAGILLVPITGRPAGWCDHIARFWPVDAVIGENGAFAMRMDPQARRLVRSETLASKQALAARRKLVSLRARLKRKFAGLRFASDQAYREYDLAIDICEDVKPWSQARVEQLLAFCTEQGAHAKLSSVHVNAWFGDYTKYQGFTHALRHGVLAATQTARLKPDAWVFIGDSPNDEPLFAEFRNSVGVANLKRYLPQLKHPPTLLMRGESGAGFVEMAEWILKR